jgi:hypothetical protein
MWEFLAYEPKIISEIIGLGWAFNPYIKKKIQVQLVKHQAKQQS